MHQELDLSPGICVLDRTIFEDAEIFATALHQMRKFNGRDWATYWDFYQIILNAIRPPDLMIYLRCSMRTIRQRIRLRGRTMEQDIPLSYLKRLERLYEQWIENYSMGEVLILESDLDGNYLKPTREQCFTEFVKAISELTISDEARHKVQIIELEKEKSALQKEVIPLASRLRRTDTKVERLLKIMSEIKPEYVKILEIRKSGPY